MGMESYYIEIIPNSVSIHKKDNIRKFEGVSNIKVSELIDHLHKIELTITQKKENIFIIDEAIQLQIIEKGKNVQVISLQGCFAWFEEGLDICFYIVISSRV